MGLELDKVTRILSKEGVLRWLSPKGTQEEIVLPDARARRLVQTLLDGTHAKLDAESGTTREKTASEDNLFVALETSWLASGAGGPEAPEAVGAVTEPGAVVPWLLEKVEATGFGGINGYSATEPFVIGISENSECLLGGNGSGKSSLISAIAWGLTGQRINDSNGLSGKSNALHPVFDPSEPEMEIGTWAPIASYPTDRDGYARPASVHVKLTFRKTGTEQRAIVERSWTSSGAPETNVVWAPELEPLKQCLDVAVEMPLKMAHLRLGEAGTLNDAISQLTGLDVLTHVGQLVVSLKLKNGRFLNTPKQAEHDQQRKDIERDFDKASTAQPDLKLELIGLKAISSWVDKPGEYFAAIEKLKVGLVSAVGNDLSTLKEFVDATLDLKKEDHQRQVAAAVTSATTAYEPSHVSGQMKGVCKLLTSFGKIDTIGADLANEARQLADKHKVSLIDVANAHRRRLADPRLGLKAAAARTHELMHGSILVDECPLCDQQFSSAQLKTLGKEIEKLKADAELLAQTLVAGCRAVGEAADADRVPFASGLAENIVGPVLQTIRGELRRLLIDSHAFTKTVPEFGRLFDQAWLAAEANEIPQVIDAQVAKPNELTGFDSVDQAAIDQCWAKVSRFHELAVLADWAVTGVPAIRKFYTEVLGITHSEDKPASQNTLRGLAWTLNRVVNRARPAGEAIDCLTHAMQLARLWLPNEMRKQVRLAICEGIEPLKNLPKFVEADVARQLSTMTQQIEPVAARFHTAAPFRFSGARLEREPRQRKGLLRARATPTQITKPERAYELDASLVANSSWMRALLWAFLFAIRQDRAKQLGGLALPLILLDDPQTTFDQEHRCAWIEAVLDTAGGSSITPKPHVLFSTHDEHFAMQIDLLIKGFTVRHISFPDAADKVLFVSGRILVDRVWALAQEKQTNQACMDAIGEIRKHLELMVKVIFPASQGAKATTLGQLMDELRGRVRAKDFPYNQSEFEKLLCVWSDALKEPYRKALSMPHHELKPIYDFNYTRKLFAWCLNDLYKAFYNAFEIIWGIQKAGWKLPHAGAVAPFSARKIEADGWAVPLPANLNDVIGRVAAESDGRSGGFGEPGVRLTLKRNMGAHELREVDVCVLAAPTLEPVAEVGDLLLVSHGLPPTHNSLVVCEAIGVNRARRYSELAGGSGTAALVASAVNPRETRRTIVIAPGSEGARKVIGVVFRCDWDVPPVSENEVVNFESKAALERLLAESEGLVRVVGESAEPIALDGQHLIIGKAIGTKALLAKFDGKPIVAVKSDDAIFKRLRLTKVGIVLESIDISGRHPPVVINDNELGGIEFRPVLGVIFDLGQVQSLAAESV
ncbi:MAG TPA: AAA family ATPase [Rhizomicrobium sp.]